MLIPTLQLLASTAHEVPLTVREALSGIFGSISLAAWIFLLLPQLLENYRNQSAEAISLPFITIWFIGDICNLFGGLWADLVPVVLAIGGYFCILDVVLLSQTLYYGIRNRRREGKSILDAARGTVRGSPTNTTPTNADPSTLSSADDDDADINTPLLRRQSRTQSITIPGSRRLSESSRRRRSSLATATANGADDHLAKILEESDDSGVRLWFKNVISILAIIAIASVGWALAYESGAWTPAPDETPGTDEPRITPGAQVLGYASAVLYLTARIPQIIQNHRDKSCEGLSLLFFILSLIGNLTYGAGILAHSTQRDYVIKNIPWLIGSLGTMAEDIIIFVQFHIYRDAGKLASDESAVA